jgi:hypothetical protein
MTEIDPGHLVAFRAVAQNAIRAKQPPAFFNVSRGVSVLRQQDNRQRQQQRKWNQSHAYCLSWEIGSYGIAAGERGQYRKAHPDLADSPVQLCHSALQFTCLACHYIYFMSIGGA